MTEEQQNIAWQGLPPEAKELARNLYNTSHIEQYMAVLELLFGEENLTGEQHTDKIKIEDMTLAQIKKLKRDLSDRIDDVLNYYERVGMQPRIRVDYENDCIGGNPDYQYVNRKIDISFGIEI